MRTKMMISVIVGAVALSCLLTAVALTLWLGWRGVAISLGAAGLVLFAYVKAIGPWQRAWGATDGEVARAMPGDDLIPDAATTTRALTIHARPESVWPWLIQIGYGRGGWYSYDWIDNDGAPSADHIIPELQHLKVGDVIQMLPGQGPAVVELVPNDHFVAGDGEGGVWCLAVYPEGAGTRLVSRWRQAWKADSPQARFFVLIADPGAFIMERKMLLGIKKRVESDNHVPVHTLAVEMARAS